MKPKDANQVREILALAAKDDPHALRFLEAYWQRGHYVDDQVDEGKLPTPDAEAAWLFTLAVNPFFVQHSNMLVPAMVLGINAWADSNAMAPGPVRDVVKGFWHEVVYLVAFIRGGWGHMREVSKLARLYDIEPDGRGLTKRARACPTEETLEDPSPNGTVPQ